ncbi:MAG: type II secretion system protein N [Pseudohongiella sp.]|nr:type II secretion system protein N [Pseudohongiella sp.]MDO9520752.1 type II secretion system protein N [Pseudohongiella sp.]MDP2126963.1 type II secretion system protein N [Pseudohongiella sp.]
MPNKTKTQSSASGWKRWLGFFLLICVIALVWSIPASVLPRLLAMSGASGAGGTSGNSTPVVQISQTRGTLWSGQAAQVLISANQQQLILENVSWRFNWRSLLDTRLCLDISSSPVAQTTIGFEGQSCFFTSGAIHLNSLLFELPASMLVSAQLAGSPLMRTLNSAVQIRGDISGMVDNLVWHAGQLQQLSARGLWSDAAVGMQLPDAQTFRMRQQQLRLNVLPWTAESRAPNELFLHVRSSDIEPAANADLQVDSQSQIWLDGRYSTQLQLGVMSSTPQFLQDILAIIAEPQGSGIYRLVWRSAGV